MKLRLSVEDEVMGLDEACHGEGCDDFEEVAIITQTVDVLAHSSAGVGD